MDQVILADWNWYLDSDGDVRLTGLIANNSSRPVKGATPQFRLLDSSGRFVGVAFTAREFRAPLAPGESGAFAFYEFTYGRDIADVEPAGVVEVVFDDVGY